MKKEAINPESLWKPNPPVNFSWGIKVTGGTPLFLAGQVAWDSEGKVVGKGDIARQAEQIFENLKAILEQAGGSLADVVKLTVYLTDMKQARKVWEVRSRYFSPPYPCSTGLEVSRLASEDLLIEVEAWAVIL